MSNLKIKQMVRSSFSTLFFIRENRVRKDGTTIISPYDKPIHVSKISMTL